MITDRAWKKICKRDIEKYHVQMVGPEMFEEAMRDVNELVPMDDLLFKRYKAFMKGILDRDGTIGDFTKVCVWASRFGRGVALSQCDARNRELLLKIDGELDWDKIRPLPSTKARIEEMKRQQAEIDEVQKRVSG